MTTDYTFIGMLVVTCVSAFSSLASTISAQTNSIGTYSLSSSFTASSGVLGLLPELLLLVVSSVAVVVMGAAFFKKGKSKTKSQRMSELFRRLGRRSPEATVWPDREHEDTTQPIPQPKLPPRVDDDDNKPIPPPNDQLPLPPPVGDDAPRLPAAALSELATGNPSLEDIEAWAKKYLDGPVDARAALPWDSHEYPPTQPVPEEVIAIYDREEWITQKILAWWKSKGKEQPEDGGRGAPKLPAVANRRTASQVTRKLLGPTPLDRYDEYLQANGIRYFSAKELTKHNWFKATKKPMLKGVSAWQCFLEVIPPDNLLQFVVPQYVVPNPRLWPNIIPMLRILDRFRHWLRSPVRGVSGYRLPWYNRAIGGSQPKIRNGRRIPGSFHMVNGAVDFAYSKFTREGEMDVSIFYRFFDALYKLKGSGVGGYPQFCHADYDHGRHNIPGKAVRWVHAARKNKNNIFHDGERYAIVGSKR